MVATYAHAEFVIMTSVILKKKKFYERNHMAGKFDQDEKTHFTHRKKNCFSVS